MLLASESGCLPSPAPSLGHSSVESFNGSSFQPGRSLGSSGQAQLPLDVANIAAWATINGLIFLTLGAVLGAMLDTWIEQTKR